MSGTRRGDLSSAKERTLESRCGAANRTARDARTVSSSFLLGCFCPRWRTLMTKADRKNCNPMRCATRQRALVALAIVAAFWWIAAARVAVADEIVPGHVLVRLNPHGQIGSISARFRARVHRHIEQMNLYNLQLPSTGQEEAVAQQISQDPAVAYAEPDTFIISPEYSGES